MKFAARALPLACAAMFLVAGCHARFMTAEDEQVLSEDSRISLPDGSAFNDPLDPVKYPLCRYGYAIPVPPYRNPNCINRLDCACLTHRRCIRSHMLPGPLPPLTNCACDYQFLDSVDRFLTQSSKMQLKPFLHYWKTSFCLGAVTKRSGRCKIKAFSGRSKKNLDISSLLFSCPNPMP
jgi:hypothetical protein